MTLSDVTLLFKKILLGFALVIIPLLILWLGVRFSLRFANRSQPADSSNVTINTNK